MSFDPYLIMQSAVDIVGTSEHPTNKVAAAIAGTDANGKPFSLARVNTWPEAIRESFGEKKIGGSSGTVHAETACLLSAPMADGSSLFVTDPPCPNCVKNMVEAGVKDLYIDHKGFDKDFAARRGEDFRDMSISFCEKSGIRVHKIFRKERRVETILDIPTDYEPALERPASVFVINGPVNEKWFHVTIEALKGEYDRRNFAAAVAYGRGESFVIAAEIHPIAGFTAQDPGEGESKYNHFLQPVHRLLMTAARYAMKIDQDYLFCSRVPTAREQVNMVGAGLTKIMIDHADEARDEDALEALAMMTQAEILKIRGF